MATDSATASAITSPASWDSVRWTIAASATVAAVATSLVGIQSWRLRHPKWARDARRLLQQQRLSQREFDSFTFSSDSSSLSSSSEPAPLRYWIVTGASAGLGLELVLRLRQEGFGVLMLVRDLARGLEAMKWVEQQLAKQDQPATGGPASSSAAKSSSFESSLQPPSAPLQLFQCDIGDFGSMERCLAQFERLFRSGSGGGGGQMRLAGLVNNAGVMRPMREVDETAATGTGWEKTIQVNHLGLAYFTSRLVPMLQDSAVAEATVASSLGTSPSVAHAAEHCWARVVNVGSRLEARGTLDLSDPFFELRPWTTLGAYADSKLLMMLWSNQLHRTLAQQKGVRVSVVAVTPGMVATSIGRDVVGQGLLRRVGGWVFNRLLARPASVAVESILWACVAPMSSLHSALSVGSTSSASSSSSSSFAARSSASPASSSLPYTGECSIVAPSVLSQDSDDARCVWEWTAKEWTKVAAKAHRDFMARRAWIEAFRVWQDRSDVEEQQQQQQQKHQRQALQHRTALAQDPNIVRVFRTPNSSVGSGSDGGLRAAHHAFLVFQGRVYPCAIGRSGLAASPDSKREGDGCTPSGGGPMPLRGAWARWGRLSSVEQQRLRGARGLHACFGTEEDQAASSSRMLAPADVVRMGRVPLVRIRDADVWVDDATSTLYNTYASLPVPATATATAASAHAAAAAPVAPTSPSSSLLSSAIHDPFAPLSNLASAASPAASPAFRSFEFLSQDRPVYHLFCVLGHNDSPAPRAGEGSAIFLHVASSSSSSASSSSSSWSSASSSSSEVEDGPTSIPYLGEQTNWAALARSNHFEATQGCIAVSRAHMIELMERFDRHTRIVVQQREDGVIIV